MTTNPTPDPLAVLGRLEEIDGNHWKRSVANDCFQCRQSFPCDAIQLARAARVQQERERALAAAARRFFETHPSHGAGCDLASPCSCGAHTLSDLLGSAAPSREGESKPPNVRCDRCREEFGLDLPNSWSGEE